MPLHEQAAAAVEGALLASYEPGAWKTVTRERADVSAFTLVTDGDVEEAIRRAEMTARWVNRARDLVNRPGNDLDTGDLRRLCGRDHKRARWTHGRESWSRRDAHSGYGGAARCRRRQRQRAATHRPRRWEPRAPAREDLLLGLVGKGITFDSGGISLKPATHMEDMKGDMAGAAAVVAGIAALAALEVPVRALAVVAAAENMPGSASLRPGDILTAGNGKTIEVTNTDAEGASSSPMPSGTPANRARHTSSTSQRSRAIMSRALGDCVCGSLRERRGVAGGDRGSRKVQR